MDKGGEVIKTLKDKEKEATEEKPAAFILSPDLHLIKEFDYPPSDHILQAPLD